MSGAVRGANGDGLRARLIGLAAIIVVSSVLAIGTLALAAFERAIAPELDQRVHLIGVIIRGELQQALELGIPLDAIAGLEAHLNETQSRFEEVDRIYVRSADGRLMAATSRGRSVPAGLHTALGDTLSFVRSSVALPVLSGNEVVGEITIETNPQFVRTRMVDVFFDVLVIALIASVAAMELAIAVYLASAGKPQASVMQLLEAQREGDFRHRATEGGIGPLARAAARFNDHATDLAERFHALAPSLRASLQAAAGVRVADGQPAPLRLSDIGDMRVALFLFSIATEIATAFLPLYARAASRPEWLSPELAAAAPLLVYLVGIAALSPFAGPLAHRFGPRRLFLAAVPVTVLALAAMGLSDDVLAIAAWRAVLALCYALATVACHEYALRASPRVASARPITAFLCVIYGGVFCGTALGGVVAGRFGQPAAFACGAVIALLAGLIAAVTMRGRAGDPDAAAAPRAAPTPVAPPMAPGRFNALLLGIAVPMNAATAIFIWYLTPLMLAATGSGTAEIARVVMLYYLTVVLFAPAVAGLSDGRTGPTALILTGGATAGSALLLLPAGQGFWAITAVVTALGLGHTLMRAPLYALAQQLSGGSTRALGQLRLGERGGALLGLTASAIGLRSGEAPSDIVTALGITVLAGLASYAVVEMAARRRQP